MLTLGPYAIAGALAASIVIGLSGYFYGHSQGYNSALAEQAETIKAALDDFQTRVAESADKATREALEEFKQKTALLGEVTEKIQKAQGTINAAASKLSASLRNGMCVLTPQQRMLLECVRRPNAAGCSASAPAVSAPVH
jgi:uncharacterized protein YukE